MNFMKKFSVFLKIFLRKILRIEKFSQSLGCRLVKRYTKPFCRLGLQPGFMAKFPIGKFGLYLLSFNLTLGFDQKRSNLYEMLCT